MPALRASFKRVFDQNKGNKHISIKAADDGLFVVAYMFHEARMQAAIDGPYIEWLKENVVVYNKGHSDEDLVKYVTHNREVQEQIVENTPTQICSRVVSLFIERPNRDEKDIVFAILDDIRNNGTGWFPNKFQMDRYLWKVQDSLAAIRDAGSGSLKQWGLVRELWYSQHYRKF